LALKIGKKIFILMLFVHAFAVPVNVLPLDLDPKVSVRPALFMPKAKGMGHFVGNYAQLNIGENSL
jgi:hypothetical protein